MAMFYNVVIGIITSFMLHCDFAISSGDLIPDGPTDLARIKHIFPGRYDNRLQHQLDILRNISEPLRHQLLHVNVTLMNKTSSNGAAQFLFVAVDPNFKEFPSNRLFIIRNFNITDQLLVRVGDPKSSEDLRLRNSCDMMWKATDSRTFHNAKVVPCAVQGADDQYVVNTWFELTRRMFSVDERWTTSPDHKPLPGPTSPYRFIKQPLHKPTN